MDVIDIEIMKRSEIVEAVDEAVQKASRGDTAMFDWLCRRAYQRHPWHPSEFTSGQKVLQRALEQVRCGRAGE